MSRPTITTVTECVSCHGTGQITETRPTWLRGPYLPALAKPAVQDALETCRRVAMIPVGCESVIDCMALHEASDDLRAALFPGHRSDVFRGLRSFVADFISWLVGVETPCPTIAEMTGRLRSTARPPENDVRPCWHDGPAERRLWGMDDEADEQIDA